MAQINFILDNVEKLICKFNTRDPFEICDNLNIRIHYKDLGPSLKAYYFCQSRIKNIVLNSNSDEIMCRVLCAHELGHAVLHEKLTAAVGLYEFTLYDSLVPTEYEANSFAAELLISDENLFELLHNQNKTFFEIAQILCVPPELLGFKVKILNSNGCNLNTPMNIYSNFLKK